jgi:hypothetical protein
MTGLAISIAQMWEPSNGVIPLIRGKLSRTSHGYYYGTIGAVGNSNSIENSMNVRPNYVA